MSVLQKLFNFIHSCPKASHFKVRDLNVYFKNSLNPSYKLINLDNIDFLELQVEQIEDVDKHFNLVAYITKQKEELDIVLATFETRKEANEALHVVKNKLYSNGKSLLTIINYVLISLFLISLLSGFVSGFKTNSNSQIAGFPMTQNQNIDMGQMSNLQKQLLNQALANGGQAPSIPGGAGTPDVGNIVAEAIRKGQNANPITGEQEVTNAPAPGPVVEQTHTAGDDLVKSIK